MKLVVITHTPHFQEKDALFAYGPYVREMNLWIRYADTVEIVTPIATIERSPIHERYEKESVEISRIPAISFVSVSRTLQTLVKLPVVKWKLFSAMRRADHIHLRCPGTIGLVGCFLQIFFPKKPKTAKYAGNWDPNSKQPFSYRLQKWILSNTFLTRNMQVLVYGDWPKQSKNIKPFFTASYPKSKIGNLATKNFEGPFRFLFVGSLAPGKRPLYAVQLLHELHRKGVKCFLDMYGEGAEGDALENYIGQHNLSESVKLHGNKSSDQVETAYKQSEFLILPSKSEGWPKVIAEAMFWGVIPIATPISCVAWMLEEGQRGILLTKTIERDSEMIFNHLKDASKLQEMSRQAQIWSQHYSLDDFEAAIKKLLV
ncbi:glycosyltransferase involved in cell wall biosynthesis [Ulvibacter sp. MAR_2010_11]|uniref:glycosyltransferase family 4 protein n=1 Tax=Ulvibacter sp. MAR_2010_11 TaxID=1250229 RepID=UPI000C2C9F6E|nr:glycosyltransferase family 4 protein [Ulvibacter sp. MAR_2010_11]PKA82107.1 glycosyltransferase involved in cell wall biosynthesis [Ulvibacter sp. MAR_2010_11]